MKIKEKILKRCESKFCAQCEPWQGGKLSPSCQESLFVPSQSHIHKANFPRAAKKASLCPASSVATKQIFPNWPGKQVCVQSVPQPPGKFSPTSQESKFVPNSSRGHKANFLQPDKKASLCPIRSAATKEIFPNRPGKQVCAQPAPQPQSKRDEICKTNLVSNKRSSNAHSYKREEQTLTYYI